MRPQSRVHLTVSTQAASVFEGLATLLTHIWPLTCVLPQMVLVVRAPFESERAVRALECPDSCVYLDKINVKKYLFTLLGDVLIFLHDLAPIYSRKTYTCILNSLCCYYVNTV